MKNILKYLPHTISFDGVKLSKFVEIYQIANHVLCTLSYFHCDFTPDFTYNYFSTNLASSSRRSCISVVVK